MTDDERVDMWAYGIAILIAVIIGFYAFTGIDECKNRGMSYIYNEGWPPIICVDERNIP